MIPTKKDPFVRIIESFLYPETQVSFKKKSRSEIISGEWFQLWPHLDLAVNSKLLFPTLTHLSTVVFLQQITSFRVKLLL